MNAIISLIERTSKKPILLSLIGALILFNVLMNAPGLPTSTPSMQKISPGFTPFDLQAKGYTPESFTADLTKLGQEGRDVYRNFMICDIFFPAIYALTFSSLIFLVFAGRAAALKWLFLVPLVTGFTDYVENLFISISFLSFPSPDSLTVNLASIATQTKMVCNVLLIMSLLVTIAIWITARVRHKN